MTFKLITPPAALAVSLEDARLSARTDGVPELDPAVIIAVNGITEYAEHYCQRGFIHQTWRLTLDSFPTAIRLKYPPIVSVVSIKYLDENGVQQTLNPSDYFLDDVTEPGYVVPSPGKAWPATYSRINSVTVDFVVGYGDSPAAVPYQVRQYILATLQQQFDPAVRLEKDTVQASFLDRLMDRTRSYA